MANSALYDSNSAMYVLGAIMRKPEIVHESDYILSTQDFEGLHKMVFGAMYNISTEGATVITPGDVDLYLRQYSTQYQKYKKLNGFEYLERLSQLVDLSFEKSQFNYYYERIKKFTILKDLDKAGFDIKQFYNSDAPVLEIDKENEKLNEIDIKEIFNRVRERLAKVEDSNVNKTNLKAISVGENLNELIEELSRSPEVGRPLQGKILNYASRGARLGKYFLYSAPTGHGKTRTLVGDACSLSLPQIVGDKVIIRDYLEPVLFVATEMEPDEIQTLVLAWVSGVNEEKILTGSYTDDERRLVLSAAKIIKQYSENFKIEKISDPSIGSVRSKIIRYVLTDKIYHVFYDYIFTSPSLNFEFQKTGLREDVTLMMLSNTLKEIASDYHIFMMSGTQVNRGWEKRHFRNENNIAGSKAIADKADFGMIATKLSDEEFEAIGTLINEMNLDMPNIVIDIYKNRRGRIVNAKLYRLFDYGTCRAKDIVLTDTNYNMIHDLGEIDYPYKKKDLLEIVVDNYVNNEKEEEEKS